MFWLKPNPTSSPRTRRNPSPLSKGGEDVNFSSPIQNKSPKYQAILGAFFSLIPAATYVPTQLPAQYHRPNEA